MDVGDLEVGVVHLVVLDRLLRATTKKRSSTVLRKKCTPRENPGLAYGHFCYALLESDDKKAIKKLTQNSRQS